MKLQQQKAVNSPLPNDKLLQQFTAIIQQNLADLFAVAHDHTTTSSQKAAYNALTTDAERIAFLANLLGLS